MSFPFPTVRREPKDHSSHCYLCLTIITGSTSKSKHTDLPSAMRPVPHGEEFPVPKSPENLTFSYDNSDSDEDYGQQKGDNLGCDLTFEKSCSSS